MGSSLWGADICRYGSCSLAPQPQQLPSAAQIQPNPHSALAPPLSFCVSDMPCGELTAPPCPHFLSEGDLPLQPAQILALPEPFPWISGANTGSLLFLDSPGTVQPQGLLLYCPLCLECPFPGDQGPPSLTPLVLCSITKEARDRPQWSPGSLSLGDQPGPAAHQWDMKVTGCHSRGCVTR